VAVGAQQLKIGEPVVATVPVDVMQRHRQRPAAPLTEPTHLAAVLLDPGADEPVLQVVPAAVRVGHQEALERKHPVARHDRSALDRGTPGLTGKLEVRDTLSDAVSVVVEALDRAPVVAAGAALIHRMTKAPGVVRDGGLAQ
jgi:hypothetical protein